MKRREEDEGGHVSSERWLLTYSDMITLLMIFFIIMYAISTVNQAKFQSLAQSLNIVFEGGTGMFDAAGPSMIEGLGAGEAAAKAEEQLLAKVQEELDDYLEEEGLGKTVTIKSEERGLVISFQEMILFNRGEASLTPPARSIVSKVGTILSKIPNYIRVEGHTCNLPLGGGAFRSNWELSSARATNVVHEFITAGHVQPQRLSATAYGEYRPRKPNDSESNRVFNRRVDIVVLNSKYQDIEPDYLDAPGSQLEQEPPIQETRETEPSAAMPGEEKPADTTYIP